MQRAISPNAKDDRRLRLLEAALDEFFERGFAAARMEDIAKRIDLSKGTVYLYFKSKDELFRALIAHLATPNIEIIEGLITQSPGFGDAMNRLAAFAPALIRESRMPKLMKVLIGDSHTFPDIIKTYRETVMDRLLHMFAKLLERAKEAGEIQVGDPLLAARLILAPVAFSALWHATFNKASDAEVDLETLFSMHANAMKAAFLTTETTP